MGIPTELCQTEQDVDDKLVKDSTMLKTTVEMYNRLGSNWILQPVDQITFDCSEVRLSLGGAAGKPSLPEKIMEARCVINFDIVDDNKCFLHAILVALHHKEFQNPHRIPQYQK